jgi:hypothetical protein
MQENRDNERKLVLRTGWIVHVHLPDPIGCAILNISRTGACVLVPTDANIPDVFDLAIDREYEPLRCRRIWQRGAKVGIKFVDGGESDSRRRLNIRLAS